MAVTSQVAVIFTGTGVGYLHATGPDRRLPIGSCFCKVFSRANFFSCLIFSIALLGKKELNEATE